jgi:type II secretory ATPase GspE/PulE/Tfp pilus assembly ATPase PilB-like protein
MTRRLQDAVESGASTGALRALAVRDGMVPMWQDGVEKARLGLTTLEEIASIAAGSLDDDALESDQSDARAMAA